MFYVSKSLTSCLCILFLQRRRNLGSLARARRLAAAGNIKGASFVILLSSTYFISYFLGCGRSTNTRSQLLALWALLTVSFHLGIPLLSVYGDSQVIISWVNRKASLNAPLLSHWCDDILSLLQLVPLVTINHIYREHNQQADILSKQALMLPHGHRTFFKYLDGRIIDQGDLQLF